MDECVCVYICVCARVRVCVCLCARVWVFVGARVYAYVHLSMPTLNSRSFVHIIIRPLKNYSMLVYEGMLKKNLQCFTRMLQPAASACYLLRSNQNHDAFTLTLRLVNTAI
jgi:hypothetical protein